jgi:hypothetical protein
LKISVISELLQSLPLHCSKRKCNRIPECFWAWCFGTEIEWHFKMKLFNAGVNLVLLYGCKTWADLKYSLWAKKFIF